MSTRFFSKRLFRPVDFLYVQYSYLVISRFKVFGLHVPDGKKRGVVLSFDVETWEDKCGGRFEPSADPKDEYFKYLPGLLDILEEYSVQAQFFACGKAVELYPGIFEVMLKKGHGIGGHGYAHEKMHMLSTAEQLEIVKKVRSTLHERLGIDLKSWRCPELGANRGTYRVLNEFGVKFSSNAPWGSPMLIKGVLELPMVRRMDGQILGYGASKCSDPKEWADYMIKKFQSVDRGILIFGMHTWVQRKYDPKYDALVYFLRFLEPHRSEVWLGKLDDLERQNPPCLH